MDIASDNDRQFIQSLHPGLRDVSWDIKSSRDIKYNCIAFALGIENQRWQPGPNRGDYWPRGIPQDDTDAAWLAMFQKQGFSRCDNGNHEDGFDKLAIYADVEGPTHVARQVSQGVWHSKMGHLHDIIHPLHALKYGRPKYFLKRSKSGPHRPSKFAQERALRK
ncbi:MAG: hypothetical protein ABSH22_16910 [Tepidisphaeraceae bacterium]|jgi:hypothetical protein